MKKLKLLLAANLVSTIGNGITGYLVIWLLIDQLNQSVLYGYLTIFVMFLIILITPYIGNLIDKYSRKNIFYYLEIIGAAVLTSFTFFYSLDIQVLQIILLVILICYLNLYDSIKYPTLAALSQEMFKESEYNKVNSSLEVQGQTALMVSSAIAAFIIGSISFNFIVVLNIITYIISAILIRAIPYQPKVSNTVPSLLDKKQKQTKPLFEFINGIKYLREKPFYITLVLLVSLSPSLVIVVMNYLEPIFIYKFLNEGPEILGIANIVYAVGAIIGGLISIWVAKKVKRCESIIFIFIHLYIRNMYCLLLSKRNNIYTSKCFMGISNSSSRIFRKDFMFNNIENDYMGRITVTFDSIKLSLQSLTLLIITTLFVSRDEIIYGYLTLAFLTFIPTLLIIFYKFNKSNRNN